MDKVQNPTISHSTTSDSQIDDLVGLELGEEARIWKEVACSEARMTMMKNMISENLAFADLEEFGADFTNKLKAINTKNKILYRKISKPAMKMKLVDEQMWRRDLVRVKMTMRKDLMKKLNGEKSRPFRRAMKHLNKIAKDNKDILNNKYNI